MISLKPNKSILGLDIGSYSIKAVLLGQTKSGLVLKTMGLANLPPDAIVESAIQEKETVTKAIKTLVKAIKSNVKTVCTSISGYSVIIKKINLPATTRQELAESIEVEAEQYIPFDISEVNVAFEILGASGEDEQQMDVILAAAKRDVIDNYIEILVDAGLKPAIVDVDVFALENAFTANFPGGFGVVALVDIGANKMNINVLKNGASLFTRDAPMGGARITEEIMETFGVDYETAEGIKLGGIEPPDPERLGDMVTRAVENWAAEMGRAFDFLEASYPDEKLEHIYISGGSSCFEDLDSFLAQETGVPVTRFNPFKMIGLDPKKFDAEYIDYIGPRLAICMGLALRMGEAS